MYTEVISKLQFTIENIEHPTLFLLSLSNIRETEWSTNRMTEIN